MTSVDLTEPSPARTDRVDPACNSLLHRRVDLVALTISVDRGVLHETIKQQPLYPQL